MQPFLEVSLRKPMTDSVDAISLEVFKSIFTSVAEEMGVTLRRAAFSPNIRERLDFSCAVFDSEARMIAQAAHIPVHLGSMPASVKAAIEAFPNLHPGDVVILNDPYHGGSHLPDITLVSPIVVNQQTAFFVASRAHHADVGGMSPGSLPLSTELYQEGMIIPPLLLYEQGVRNEGLLQLILSNSRAPQERVGDLSAQIAANQLGAQRLLDLIEKHTISTLVSHAQALQDYSRQMTQALIQSLPDGVYSFEDALEGDGQSTDRLFIRAKITISDSEMIVDFTDSAAQTLGNVNTVPPVVRSATWYCVRLLAEEDIPVNEGCIEPIKVIVPPTSLLDPQFPAAVAVGNTETSQRIVDVVLGALSKALPERVPAASQGSMNNLTIGSASASKAFVYYETIAGGHGASLSGDGLSGRHSHMTNTLNTPIEALEQTLPFRVLEYCLRESSGGEGRFRGGEGIQRVYEFLSPVRIALNTERRDIAPYGLQGGEAGQVGMNTAVISGQKITLDGKATLTLGVGHQLIIETPGGGGWGKKRDETVRLSSE
jgi:N-methylhydantoinase B